MNYVWNPQKARINWQKHGVRFTDAVSALEDDFVLWREDQRDYYEPRFIAVGMDYLGRVLTVVFVYRENDIRIISARKATKKEISSYERNRF